MICYHQNLIRRTLGLTISPFFMMKNLGYLGEEESPPQTNHGSTIKIYNVKNQDDQNMLERICNKKQCKS